MTGYNRDGDRIANRKPRPEPSQEQLADMATLDARAQKLVDEHDHLVDSEARLRHAIRETDARLDQISLGGGWLSDSDRQAFAQHRLGLVSRLDGATSDREAIERQITEAGVALPAQMAASMELPESPRMFCPVCGRETMPYRTAPAANGRRQAWYDCTGCDTQWSATWSERAEPIVQTGLRHRGREI